MIIDFNDHERIFPLMPLSTQASLKNRVSDSFDRVTEKLGGRLELPKKLDVSFVDEIKGKSLAQGGGGFFGSTVELSLRTSVGFNDERVLDGIIGHEISHVSDALHNPLRCGPMLPLPQVVVAEGKGDQLGVFTGGEEYKAKLVEELDESEKMQNYWMIFNPAARIMHSINRARDWFNYEPVRPKIDAYAAGFTLIGDVLAHSGQEDLLAVHHEPHSYFVERGRELWRSQISSLPPSLGGTGWGQTLSGINLADMQGTEYVKDTDPDFSGVWEEL